MKIINSILMITAILGINAMVGSDCPALTDAEQVTNLNTGAALFFGSAGIRLLIKDKKGGK